MARTSYTWNAYESKTKGPLASGATSVEVVSAVGLVAPVYLVLEPDDPSKREWIRVNEIDGDVLKNLSRNLEGSVGNLDHESEVTIRAIYTKQVQDDIFHDIEDLELSLYNHKIDTGDPHANAGYIKIDEGDARYLRLAGGTMKGSIEMGGQYTLRNLPTPSAKGDAVSWDFVDAHYLRLSGGVISGNLTVEKDLNIGSVATAHLVIDETPQDVYRFYVSNSKNNGNRYGLQFFANQNDFLDVSFDGHVYTYGEVLDSEARFRNISNGVSAPPNPVKGTYWIDQVAKTFNVWNGSSWVTLFQGS